MLVHATRGFSRGNYQDGVVEWRFGIYEPGLQHLIGEKVMPENGISHVLIAQKPGGTTRLYGVEESGMKAEYERVVRRAGFSECGFFKMSKILYRFSGQPKVGSENASRVQFTIRAHHMPYWDNTVRQERFNPTSERTGEGFIEFDIEAGLAEPHSCEPRWYRHSFSRLVDFIETNNLPLEFNIDKEGIFHAKQS